MAVPSWFKRLLTRYQVPFQAHHHPPVFSASRLAQIEHVSGYRVVKPVFLCSAGRPVTVVLPACVRVDLSRVQGVVGSNELRLASEPEIAGWFKGCQPGAVPPLRLLPDQQILMDRALARLGRIVFAVGTPQDAVSMRFRDWYRMVRPGVGRFAAANGQADGQAPAPRLLVVEDEPETSQLLCRLLEKEGFSCHAAEQGSRALALSGELAPSAIVLDLMLPDMSGLDMYERLRRIGPIRRPAVVVVTALDDEATRQRGLQLGADAYLTKPFRPEALVEELKGVLADALA